MCVGNKFVSEEISRRRPNKIILHANWILYEDQRPGTNLINTLNYIKKMSPDSKVVLVGGVPQYAPSLPTYMANRRIGLTDNARLVSPMYGKIAFLDSQLSSLASSFGAKFFSPLDSLCDSTGCLVVERYKGELMPTAWDYGHLTSAGSVLLAAKFRASEL